jgi:CxxC motif-containing protein (DUF1111 family)
MKWLLPLLAAGVVAAAAGPACSGASYPDVTAEAGAPLPGLSAAELERFEAGRVLFAKVYTPEEGLGPVFSENACTACHHQPETGGGSGEAERRAVRYADDGTCDPLREHGGLLRGQLTPLMRELGHGPEDVPPAATHTAYFLPLPLFGAGLIEAVPDAVLERLARSDGSGVPPGRVSRLPDGSIGRFRRKADRGSLVELVEAGLANALGLTSPRRPEELHYRGAAVPAAADPVADPEVDQRTVEILTDYIRWLAPPARAAPADDADAERIAAGDALFHEVGCARCHVPVLRTGDSDVAALRRKSVPLYSDLLLHDLGSELASACGPSASPTETRTAPLWGLRYRSTYLHDGRAVDLWQAIEMHGGAARSARDAFRSRDEVSQAALIRFLSTL